MKTTIEIRSTRKGGEKKTRFPLVKNKRIIKKKRRRKRRKERERRIKASLKYEEKFWMRSNLSCSELQIRDEFSDKTAE